MALSIALNMACVAQNHREARVLDITCHSALHTEVFMLFTYVHSRRKAAAFVTDFQIQKSTIHPDMTTSTNGAS